MEIYNSEEAQKIIGISKAKIQRFVADGLLIPLKDSSGPGTARAFSEMNLIQMYLIRLLFENGLTTPKIKEALDTFREGIQKSARWETDVTSHPGFDDFLVYDRNGWSYHEQNKGMKWFPIRANEISTITQIIHLRKLAAETHKLIESYKNK